MPEESTRRVTFYRVGFGQALVISTALVPIPIVATPLQRRTRWHRHPKEQD